MKIRYFLLFIFSGLLFACSDANSPSAVDAKGWNLDSNKDLSYQPSDNFYMYCVGSWYKKVDLGANSHVGFIYNDVPDAQSKRMGNLDEATINTFWADSLKIDQTTKSGQDAINANLKIAQNITTEDDVCNAIAKAIMLGYTFPIKMSIRVKSGKIYALFLSTDVIGDSEAYNIQKTFTTSGTLSSKSVCSGINSNSLDDLVPLRSAMSRSTGYDKLDKLATALGISADNVLVDPSSVHYINDILSVVDDKKEMLNSVISADMQYTSRELFSQYNKGTSKTLASAMNLIKERYMAYIYAHAFASKYFTEEWNTYVKNGCEELRASFLQRIDNLDWMNESTKVKAREKLAALAFCMEPDEWASVALPTLTGKSLIEDIMQLRQANFNFKKSLIGKNISQQLFNFRLIDSGFLCLNSDVNYNLSYNAVFIDPGFLMQPLLDSSYSDAFNYASMVIVAHEMIHGFDDLGSCYDKDGTMTGWWGSSDRAEYANRQKVVIDNYGMLQLLPDELPDVYCDATRTLRENIADIGGFNIAYQAYVDKLLRDGYKDDELLKQEKKFFESYANIRRAKYTASFVKERLTDNDTYALPKERVNGVMINCDSWYDLYGVKWGDALYFKPEARAHIW